MTVTEMLKGMSMVHLYLKFFCFFGARLKSSKRELGGRGKRQSRSTRKHLKSPTGPLGGREPLESAYATTGPTSVGVEGQGLAAQACSARRPRPCWHKRALQYCFNLKVEA